MAFTVILDVIRLRPLDEFLDHRIGHVAAENGIGFVRVKIQMQPEETILSSQGLPCGGSRSLVNRRERRRCEKTLSSVHLSALRIRTAILCFLGNFSRTFPPSSVPSSGVTVICQG